MNVYRWYTPLLHLDTHVKLVQYIKLAAQECGLGTEMVRAPRLPLVGAEREQVLGHRSAGPSRPAEAADAAIGAAIDDRMQRITVIDSHTGGEPTRVVIAGGPDLGRGSLAERLHASSATSSTNSARPSSTSRAARMSWSARCSCEPVDPHAAAGVIFFNNVGVLDMCGHGTIGVAVALGALGRIKAGKHRLETPVGDGRTSSTTARTR